MFGGLWTTTKKKMKYFMWLSFLNYLSNLLWLVALFKRREMKVILIIDLILFAVSPCLEKHRKNVNGLC